MLQRFKNLSYTATLTVMLIGCIASVQVIFSGVIFKFVERSKLTDLEAILYLEHERLSSYLDRYLASELQKITSLDASRMAEKASLIVNLGDKQARYEQGSQVLFQRFQELLNQFPAERVKVTEGQAYFLKLGQEFYVAIAGEYSRKVYILPMPASWRAGLGVRIPNGHDFFLVNRFGQVIHTNNLEINDYSLSSKGLLNQFIGTMVKTGQVEVTTMEGQDKFGFFHDIPQFGLVCFMEVDKSYVLEPLTYLRYKIMLVISISLVVIVIFAQIIGHRTVAPVKALLARMKDFAAGKRNFINPKISGFGEIRYMQTVFTNMINKIEKDENNLKVLMNDRLERQKLEGELDVVQTVQDTFCHYEKLIDSNWDCATKLLPSAQASGDWFAVHKAADTGRLTLVIADISGHGAGSAMFTAVLASHFSHYKNKAKGGAIAIEEFLGSLNDIFVNLGRNKWHATMQVFQEMGEHKWTIYNLGHNAPALMSKQQDGSYEVTMKNMPSDPIGLMPSIRIAKAVHHMNPGDFFLMYTDGITECRNRQDKMYGKRSLRRLLATRYFNSNELLQKIEAAVTTHTQGLGFDDDCTMVAIRRAV